MKRLPEILGFAFIAFILLVLCQGCKARAAADASLLKPLGNVGKSTARIEVRADVITEQAKQLPESPPKSTIIEQAGGIKADTVEAAAEADKALVNMSLMAGTINNQTVEIAIKQAKLDDIDKWIIGPRGWRWIGYIIAGFMAAGVASIAFGVASPFGWGMTISRLINTIFPLMAPFVWIRDAILKTRGISVAAVPTPVVNSGA